MNQHSKFSTSKRGFSLIELMVSVSILAILMVFSFEMLTTTQRTWQVARDTVTKFKEARVAFEVVTRRLSQATMNTYWAYEYTGTGTRRKPKTYKRQSELHFTIGQSKELLGKGPDGDRVSHAVFFQAPLGYTSLRNNRGENEYSNLDSLLNAWGYYVEYNSDERDRPPFINRMKSKFPPKFRYRLMEFRQPSENLTLYEDNLAEVSGGKQQYYEWFNNKTGTGVNAAVNRQATISRNQSRTTRIVAENIIALVLSPRVSEHDAEAEGESSEYWIAPKFDYDSREHQWGSRNRVSLRTEHQLPPIVEVLMIAVDDGDATKYNLLYGDKQPEFLPGGVFENAERLEEDIKKTKDFLDEKGVGYRVFTSTVRIKESKWSVDAEK